MAANSSPPSRPTVSLARTQLRSRAAASLSSASPAPCPRVSLTSLNRSRSMNSTAIGRWLRAACAIVCVRRSRNRLRLGRPVSASNCARYETFSSIARRARMSREIAAMRVESSERNTCRVDSKGSRDPSLQM